MKTDHYQKSLLLSGGIVLVIGVCLCVLVMSSILKTGWNEEVEPLIVNDLDLGNILASPSRSDLPLISHHARVVFQNRGTRAIRVVGVEYGCFGSFCCRTVSQVPFTIAPQSTHEIVTEFRCQTGPFDAALEVHYECDRLRHLSFRISGNGVP